MANKTVCGNLVPMKCAVTQSCVTSSDTPNPVLLDSSPVDDSRSPPTSAPSEVALMYALLLGLSVGNTGADQKFAAIVEATERGRAYLDVQFVLLSDGSRRERMLQKKEIRELDNLHLADRFPTEKRLRRASDAGGPRIFDYTVRAA